MTEYTLEIRVWTKQYSATARVVRMVRMRSWRVHTRKEKGAEYGQLVRVRERNGMNLI